MPYAYYSKLKARDKAIYRRSDKIERVDLAAAWSLQPLIQRLEATLVDEDRQQTERIVRDLAIGILDDLGVTPIGVKLLAARPSDDWGELHGLYEPSEGRRRARDRIRLRSASFL